LCATLFEFFNFFAQSIVDSMLHLIEGHVLVMFKRVLFVFGLQQISIDHFNHVMGLRILESLIFEIFTFELAKIHIHIVFFFLRRFQDFLQISWSLRLNSPILV
jgi:hypothetical protein